ncbi:Sip1-related alpha-galactosidase [Fictibacillus phosphorivorans]|uniref:Sip1-related alpha-galactosidase n=1 Tax=Fictibacillus phosphorivorans TaxID=1221500 RepID=UPI00203AAD15|nr:Sip1-related alpha-galactosidase [Fictibacillus phosphorivorans]MCM3717771.1 alpha-galactosidase [Fictibacillus phosphorivorans]MCM3776999.1 alpha-galactosidase [Fictibacillus phosphorivorans]
MQKITPQKIDLKGFNTTILDDIGVSVLLDNQVLDHLTLQHVIQNESSSVTSYQFKDAGEKVNVCLTFKTEKETIIGSVQAEVKNERIQNRHIYFAPENGITITIKNLPGLKNVLAHYQHKDWWTRPYFHTDVANLPQRTQSLLWETDESFYYLLPVVDSVYRTQLAGNGTDLTLSLSSFKGGFDRCETMSFVIGVLDEPFQLSEQTIKKAIEILGYKTLPRDQKRYPEVLDYLGWCSWDAFYHKVNEAGLLEKMDELHKKDLPVKWVMIDDGWLSVKDNRLTSFEADPEKFPEGLHHTTNLLKQKYGVNWVGVWHTIAGYWGGIHPNSALASEMEKYLYRTSSGKLVPYPITEKGFGFWNSWHSKLKQQGIDFVKVDSQSAVNNFLMTEEAVGESAHAAHTALEASVGIHFDQALINCMGMAAENIWNRPMSSVSRNSDDFVPGEEISFKEHALQNAYNSYYHGQFYWGDWDMFWTNHEEDIQNAVLRAVSGGPVYFSDRPGETDADKIWPLILEDGRILRADQPGLPTKDCLFQNPNIEKVPLKIWNKVGEAGVLASFNIHLEGSMVEGSVSPSHIEKMNGETYLVYDYFKKKARVLAHHESFDFWLEKDGVALYIVIPIKHHITPIGLTHKYLTPKTLSKSFYFHNKAVVHLNEGGEFAFFVKEKKPIHVLVNGEKVDVKEQEDGLFTVDCKQVQGDILLEMIDL